MFPYWFRQGLHLLLPMPRGVCGLSVLFDLKSRTAANYKQGRPPLFSSNCLSVDLSSGAHLQTRQSHLVSCDCCRWLINTFTLALAPSTMVSSCDFNYLVCPHTGFRSTMSSRSITVVTSGRSTGLVYNGNLLVSVIILLFSFFFKCVWNVSKVIFHTWVGTLFLLCYQRWECTALSSPHSPNPLWRRTGNLASDPPLTSAAVFRATTYIPITTQTHLHAGRLTDSP